MMEVDEPMRKTRRDPEKLARTIVGWSPQEVADFLSHVDCDWMAPYADQDRHMIFRPVHFRNPGTADSAPVYTINHAYYNVQRIAAILFGQGDPYPSRVIKMACDHADCINPSHMQITHGNK